MKISSIYLKSLLRNTDSLETETILEIMPIDTKILIKFLISKN
ncbi:hypothetical protein M153_3530006683 [Pseudoloma neurophilia]|uniref:Uncharacterized protein n=1 Tax=Pseudoloma neurophilia TaxID=146866 RepID=A0A0R0M3U2_9MICR|nr:hypothetical protein M153_3530006683 [Pseudoloma neurophilia]